MPETRQRLDKWLWFARIVKTRSLAAGLVEAGHVRLNRNKILKPGHPVGPGDVLTVAVHGRIRVLDVVACAERRGPTPAARKLYREAPPEDAAMPAAGNPAAEKEDASSGRNC